MFKLKNSFLRQVNAIIKIPGINKINQTPKKK